MKTIYVILIGVFIGLAILSGFGFFYLRKPVKTTKVTPIHYDQPTITPLRSNTSASQPTTQPKTQQKQMKSNYVSPDKNQYKSAEIAPMSDYSNYLNGGHDVTTCKTTTHDSQIWNPVTQTCETVRLP